MGCCGCFVASVFRKNPWFLRGFRAFRTTACCVPLDAVLEASQSNFGRGRRLGRSPLKARAFVRRGLRPGPRAARGPDLMATAGGGLGGWGGWGGEGGGGGWGGMVGKGKGRGEGGVGGG